MSMLLLGAGPATDSAAAPNLIDNGTFVDGTGWTPGGAATISGGVLNSNGGGTAARDTNATITDGTIYKIAGDLTATAGSVGFTIGGGGDSGYAASATGPFVAYAMAGPTQVFRVSMTGDAVVDNLVVTQATPSYGADIVQNGGFGDASNWALGATVAIGSGTVNWSASTAGRLATNTPSPAVDPSSYYVITFDITSLSGGSLRGSVGTAGNRVFSTTGTFSELCYAADTTGPRLSSAGGGTTASVDNVVARKVTFP